MNAPNKHRIIRFFLMGMATAVLFGCEKNLPNPPVPPPDPTPNPREETRYCRVSVSVVTPEELAAGRQGTELSKPGEAAGVVVAGSFGKVAKGNKAEVSIAPKEDFAIRGICFAYREGTYDPAKYPTDPGKALEGRDRLSVTAAGDLKIIVIAEKVPYVQQPYAKNVQVNEAYWKEQNRKAWDLIYPNIVRPDYQIAVYGLKEPIEDCFPDMTNALHTDTIYAGEPTLMAWSIRAGYFSPKRAAGNRDLMRVAYALATPEGAIAEIYPPVYWDGLGASVLTTVYPTVPAGTYQERVLFNFVGENEWYDLPIVESCILDWIDALQPMSRYPELFLPGRRTYAWGEVMRQEDHFRSDKIRMRRVLERNSAEAPPVPRWHTARAYSTAVPTEASWVRYGNGVQIRVREVKSIVLKLSNGCNQRLKGKVSVVVRQKHWIDQNLDALDYAQRKLTELFPGHHRVEDLEEREWILGEQEVTVQPGTSGQAITIACEVEELLKTWRYVNIMNGLDSKHIIFYWQPEGSRERYFMGQDGAPVLNFQEKSSVAWDKWFSGSYHVPHPVQIELQKEVFEEYPEYGNRMQT